MPHEHMYLCVCSLVKNNYNWKYNINKIYITQIFDKKKKKWDWLGRTSGLDHCPDSLSGFLKRPRSFPFLFYSLSNWNSTAVVRCAFKSSPGISAIGSGRRSSQAQRADQADVTDLSICTRCMYVYSEAARRWAVQSECVTAGSALKVFLWSRFPVLSMVSVVGLCVCALANNAFCLMINCNAILGGRCFPQTCKHTRTHTHKRYVQLWYVCREPGTGGYIICDIKLLILFQIQIESESEATIEPGGESSWVWAATGLGLRLAVGWVQADSEHP